MIGSFLNAQTFLKSPAHHHFIYHPQCASNHRSVSDYIEFCYFEKAKKPWQPIAIGNTEDWDDLHHLDGHIVQRNCITGYFRIIEEGGVHQERF